MVKERDDIYSQERTSNSAPSLPTSPELSPYAHEKTKSHLEIKQ